MYFFLWDFTQVISQVVSYIFLYYRISPLLTYKDFLTLCFVFMFSIGMEESTHERFCENDHGFCGRTWASWSKAKSRSLWIFLSPTKEVNSRKLIKIWWQSVVNKILSRVRPVYLWSPHILFITLHWLHRLCIGKLDHNNANFIQIISVISGWYCKCSKLSMNS